MAVKPIPEGYHTITPTLTIDGAADAIEFYKNAFGAKERARMPMPDGKIAHAEIEIGDSVVMVNDPFPQANSKPPTELGGTAVGLFLYVDDVDAWHKKAVDAGAKSTLDPEDQFWGDRFASVLDPYGHSWQLATHKEDISEEEMQRRSKEALAAMTT